MTARVFVNIVDCSSKPTRWRLAALIPLTAHKEINTALQIAEQDKFQG